MNDERQYLTPEGAQSLREELEELLNVKRPALAAKLKEAIAMGDLSENADYQDAKEQQSFLEGRITRLQAILHSAIIVADDQSDDGVVRLGSEVTIQEDGDDRLETYRIVGAAEANPREGKISNESPLGRELIGKKAGKKVKVKTPEGILAFKIKSVK